MDRNACSHPDPFIAVNRRTFLRSSAVLAAFAPLARTAEPKTATSASPAPSASAATAKPKRANKKGFMFGTLRVDREKPASVRDRFQLLRDAGFAGVEVASAMNQTEILTARDACGLEIPSVVIATHWTHPLTSPNPATRKIGLDGLLQGLRDAKAFGASSVLLVPGVVNKEIAYADAYTRSVEEIKKAVPLAEELGVAIAIENVWNGFLLSPLEAAAYVDSFKSPIVRWHFDVGNVVDTGWPQHWVQTLGKRISKIHVKEFSRKIRDEKGQRSGFQVELLAGDSDWPAVMAALDSVGYSGWMIAEQYRPPNLTDAEWLRGISQKMDDILAV
jgi:L-ribulose-5-phosphate 3-epimerase